MCACFSNVSGKGLAGISESCGGAWLDLTSHNAMPSSISSLLQLFDGPIRFGGCMRF